MEKIMKKQLSLALALLFALTSFAAADDVISVNGDFETGDTSGWQYFATSDSSFSATGDAATGSFAGSLTNNQAPSAAIIKQANIGVGVVNPGDEINITFDAKGTFGVGGVSFAEFFSELSGGGVSSSEILGGAPLSLTDSFQSFSFSTIAGSDVSGGVTLQLTATTGAASGSTADVTFDNVVVSVVNAIPEPSSLCFLGFAGLALIGNRRRKL